MIKLKRIGYLTTPAGALIKWDSSCRNMFDLYGEILSTEMPSCSNIHPLAPKEEQRLNDITSEESTTVMP